MLYTYSYIIQSDDIYTMLYINFMVDLKALVVGPDSYLQAASLKYLQYNITVHNNL